MTAPAAPAFGTLPSQNQPRAAQPPDRIHFDRDPRLRELLHPDVVIRPGVEYLVCALANIPRAESEGFQVMPNQRSFTVRGIDAMVLVRGTPTPGARDSAQMVPVLLDDALAAQPAPKPVATSKRP